MASKRPRSGNPDAAEEVDLAAWYFIPEKKLTSYGGYFTYRDRLSLKRYALNLVFPSPQPSSVCTSLVISKTAHIQSSMIRRRYGHEKEYPCY